MWTEGLFDFFITIIPQSFALVLLFFSLLDIKIEKNHFQSLVLASHLYHC